MSNLKESQNKLNDSILNQMCWTFNKDDMKRLLEFYFKSNLMTNDLIALTEEVNECKETQLENKNKLATIEKDLEITLGLINEKTK
jgi:hypothetical protein